VISPAVPTNRFVFLLSLLVVLQTNVSPSKKEIFDFFLKVTLEGVDSSVDLLAVFSHRRFFARCHRSWLVVLALRAMSFGRSSFAQCRRSSHFSRSSSHSVARALFLSARQRLALDSSLDVGFLRTMSAAGSDKNHTGLSPLGITLIRGFVLTSDQVRHQGTMIIGMRIGT